MKKNVFLALFVIAFTVQINSQEKGQMKNYLLEKWETQFSTPPFDKITIDQYLPAFIEGIRLHNEEIDKIINNKEKPTFKNTIEALEFSGETLGKVARVFFAMNESMTNEKMQELSKEISPMLSKHNDDINLNEKLFKRIKSVYDEKDKLNLTKEQSILLDKYYKKFVRGGANLSGKQKDEFRKINQELALLTLQFGENSLKETNKFELVIDNAEDLAGLPESVINMAAEEANARGKNGKWVFTIQKPSMIPFLQYSQKRNLREKIYKAYINKGDNNDELDNKEIIKKITALRLRKANLLGYPTHANFVLDEQMAKNPDNVYELLNKLWQPALNVAKRERDEMQKLIYTEGNNFKLESWDWWYYAEKVKKEKYDLNEEEVRPYFKLENVISGVFGLATKLFGITFEERFDIPKYHPDVKTFEVKDSDGSHIAILFTDYFPRESKRAGAWMEAFTNQYIKDGKFVSPIIYNVGNFSKPTADSPSLLSLDDVNTLFHEFGHALHGMLSKCNYETTSGTNTPRDFVEFPSQVMENWCLHPDVLKDYAFHYQTNEPMPIELINKIQNAKKFNQGFESVEYLAASFLDMDWHTIKEPINIDANEFEKNSLNKIGLISEIIPRYRSTYFNHIFSGDYSAGYYSYIWSEVLDADAFSAFVESGDVFNKDLAGKYRKYILSSGGSDDSMELYKKFRGSQPKIDALLIKRGLN
ncbi:MAG: M3 family metallopeptidase [Ignavibacteriales bacterium]